MNRDKRQCSRCGREFYPLLISGLCECGQPGPHPVATQKHGLPEYTAWMAMKQRCYYPQAVSYPNYGGRGIGVCERWRDSFANFLADMGAKPSPAHSLDRIDSAADYTPDNCRWSTRQEQNTNRRNAIRITAWSETKRCAEWALDPRCKTTRKDLYRRITSDNWRAEDAISLPYGESNPQPKPRRLAEPKPPRQRHPRFKLNEIQAGEILASSLGRKTLAAKYGVSDSLIGAIKRRECWRSIA